MILFTCADGLGDRKDGYMSVTRERAVAWRKSSACYPSDCVEVTSIDGHILIRDSADKTGGHVLFFCGQQWSAFIRNLKLEYAQHDTCEPNLTCAYLCPEQVSGYMP
jgi:hypothetical protein